MNALRGGGGKADANSDGSCRDVLSQQVFAGSVGDGRSDLRRVGRGDGTKAGGECSRWQRRNRDGGPGKGDRLRGWKVRNRDYRAAGAVEKHGTGHGAVRAAVDIDKAGESSASRGGRGQRDI